MHEKQILIQEWTCIKCPQTMQVMLKVISTLILNVHELVETWFPDQMKWQFAQILMDSKFQSKLCVLDTDDVRQKSSLFSVQGKSAWYVLMVFCFFCFICHLCLIQKINAQTPITAILSTYLIHEFIVNVKCRMDESHRKPYISLSFDFFLI